MNIPFNDEQRRLLANLAQFYDAWISAERSLRELPPGRLAWKRVSGREYLYQIVDRQGNGKSLGPRSPENEARYERYRAGVAARDGAAARFQDTGRMYRALRLPMLASAAADILREADSRKLLGESLLVVGTNAMPAYEIEAQSRLVARLDETEDFDLAWIGSSTRFAVAAAPSSPVFEMLKAVDSTYTVNSERPFQARNAAAYEIELLVAPSKAQTLPPGEKLAPVPLPEQEWLLQGERVDQIVCARDGLPARIVAPDPRWFALHKMWLADKPKRDAKKRPKDKAQAEALLQLVASVMPHFPLDEKFSTSLPAELKEHFERWRSAQSSGMKHRG